MNRCMHSLIAFSGIMFSVRIDAVSPQEIAFNNKLKAIFYSVKVKDDDINFFEKAHFNANKVFGKDSPAPDFFGKTPLMIIVSLPDQQAALKLVDIFLNKGAQINKASDLHFGRTVLMEVPENSPAVVQKLLAAGADPLIKDKHGNTALHYMAFNADAQNLAAVIDVLKKKGLSEIFNQENSDHDTVLLAAVKSLKKLDAVKKTVELLLVHEINPHYLNSQKESALIYLRKQDDDRSRQLLDFINDRLVAMRRGLKSLPKDIQESVGEFLWGASEKKPAQGTGPTKVVSEAESMSEVD